MLLEQPETINKGLFLPGLQVFQKPAAASLLSGTQWDEAALIWGMSSSQMIAKRMPNHRLPLKASVTSAHLALATSDFNRAIFYTHPTGTGPIERDMKLWGESNLLQWNCLNFNQTYILWSCWSAAIFQGWTSLQIKQHTTQLICSLGWEIALIT